MSVQLPNLSFERVRRRHRGVRQLGVLSEHPNSVLVIHYSCESFYDRPDGNSPRITSIAARNWGTGLTISFSIHQVAERHGLGLAELHSQYDNLEKEMLQDFYSYAEKHEKYTWVHWNMRDINYGFPALEHRAKVLGAKPYSRPEASRVDLARLLVDLFDRGYIGHPRLVKLVERNNITNKDMLSGSDEADAFIARDYVKLHLSTLRKVDILANIMERAIDGSLKTNARWREIYGGVIPGSIAIVQEHWIIAAIGLIASVATVWNLVSGWGGGS